MQRPLIFSKMPELEGRVPWVPLGEYPTPVEKLAGIGAAIGVAELYVKRDDLSSRYYGGNKVRKLEFVLAQARSLGHGTVVTFGAAGSNHVAATVIHAERLGIKTIAVLMPQPNAAYARKNILLDYQHGAEFACARSIAGMPLAFLKAAIGELRTGHGFPYLIPPGGTSLLGCLGYVDAALELKEQIDAGLLPEPEFIFATYGSGGTVAGLIAGMRLAGLSCRVVPVRVVESYMCNRWLLAYYVNRTLRFLQAHSRGLGGRAVAARDILFIDDFAGDQYARATVEGMEAVKMARELDGIKLEGTYTGKTLAGMLDFVRRHGLKGRNLLFWNTFSSVDLYPTVKDLDYHLLPRQLQWYFVAPLQEQDMGYDVVY